MEGTQTVRRLLKADNGKLSQILEYDSEKRVEIPINKDGSIRWLPDKMKIGNCETRDARSQT